MTPPTTGHPLGDLAIYVAAVLIALGTIQRYIWPAIKGTARGVKAAHAVYRGTQQFIHDWTGAGERPSIPDRLDAIEVEVRKTNGGSTLRDLAIAAATATSRVEATVDRLEGYASANREGIADLREGQIEVNRRLTDVDEKVDAQGERITEHRRRNEATIDRLEAYLGDERSQLAFKAQALEASVHELLGIDAEPRQEETP